MAISIETLAVAKKLSKEYTDEAIAGIGGGGITYKGAVDYYSSLPNNASVGDAYTVKYKGSSGTEPDGSEYVWGNYEGTNQWIKLGSDSGDIPVATDDTVGGIKTNGIGDADTGFFIGVELDSNGGAYVDTSSITVGAVSIGVANIGSEGSEVNVGSVDALNPQHSSTISIGATGSGSEQPTFTAFYGNVDFSNADVTGIGGGDLPSGGNPDDVLTTDGAGSYSWNSVNSLLNAPDDAGDSVGKVLTADGYGNTYWGTPSGGSGNTDLTISVDSSTFDIVDITDENGNAVNFASYLTAVALSHLHYDLKLVFTNSTMGFGGIWHLEGLNTDTSSEITGVILFRNSSINETGIIPIINTAYSDKFPADTTDLLIKWKREYDSDEDNYVESFEWVPVCNQSKVIVPLGLSSLMAFNNIITAFMTEAVPNKLGQFVYAEINDTFTELSDILAYLNAGKEVWIDLGSNFANATLLINKYDIGGFGFKLDAFHYTITGVGDTYSSVNVEVYSSIIYAQGFVQAHST